MGKVKERKPQIAYNIILIAKPHAFTSQLSTLKLNENPVNITGNSTCSFVGITHFDPNFPKQLYNDRAQYYNYLYEEQQHIECMG